MKFDATLLLRADGSAVLGQSLSWGAPGWPSKSETMRGPFTGALTISVDTNRTISLAGPAIDSITLGPGLAQVALAFPSPVPDYCHQLTLGFVLSFDGIKWQTRFGSQWDTWLNNPNPYNGTLNDWIHKPGDWPAGRKVEFPYWEGGLGIALQGGYFPSSIEFYTGIFLDKNGHPFVLLMPAAQCTRSTKPQAAGIRLDELSVCRLGGDGDINSWTLAPAVLYFPLHPADEPPTWKVLVSWSPLGEDKPSTTNRLLSGELLEKGWNQAVRALLRAQRGLRGAQPWLPLPLLSPQGRDAPPLLRFGPAPSRTIAPPLDQAYLSQDGHPFIARFDWQADAVLDRQYAPSGQLAGTAVTFDCELTEAMPAWSTDAATALKLLDKALETDSDPTVLATWQFKITKGPAAATPSAWLTLGSLEFKVAADQAADPAAPASLECRLRGVWNEHQRDIYPDVTLSCNCLVRMSAASDPGLRNLSAEFDAASAAEADLHRDTEPLRHALDADSGRKCQLRVRHTSAPGRNSVIAMEVRSLERTPLGGNALYFQARPFIFAKVHPVDIDDQAGELIAVWRSDDPEGAQWRLPDSSLTFELPPQAVGEEMERGNRFWPNGTPYIDPSSSIKYRFAPPTTVTVQPSALARRYNKNPNNLSEVMRGAKVQSFVTEMVYPVQVTFAVSDLAEPDVRIAETAAFLGRPALNLPLPPASVPPRSPAAAGNARRHEADEAARWASSVLPGELAAWATTPAAGQLPPRWAGFLSGYRRLRSAHSASQATFAARLGQFHLYDPWRKDGGLHLRDGLKFLLRSSKQGAPASNPLPILPGAAKPIDLLPRQMEEIKPFFKNGTWDNPDTDGALRAGVLHTVEFASELAAILRKPESTGGSIDSLAFTALGASGQASAAFDEGRVTFVVETQHGQLSRLIKVRIGRIALLWNRAKHITVYERTAARSQQFEDEQPVAVRDSRGWPILRKTEEYVEPIDLIRDFGSELQKENNATGFVEASEFVSRRIYVNSAWGQDLVHGYELPLWNRSDNSGFYPKPQLALRMHAGGGTRSRCWLDEPEHLYFYSNTEQGKGSDPDRWDPKPAVDCPPGLARLPVFTGAGLNRNDYLDAPAVRAPRVARARRPRYDLALVADGKANLQHGRGETEMLATLDLVSLSRTDEGGAVPLDTGAPGVGPVLDSVAKSMDLGGRCGAIEQQVRALLDRLPRQLLESGLDCPTLGKRLEADINKLFDDVERDLTDLNGLPEFASIAKEWAGSVQKDIEASLNGWEFGASTAIRQAVERLVNEIRLLQESVQQAVGQDAAKELRDCATGRLHQLVQEIESVLKAASKMLHEQHARLAHAPASEMLKALDELEQALRDVSQQAAPTLAAVASKLAQLRAHADRARLVPPLAPIAAKALEVLDHAGRLVADANGQPAAAVKLLADSLLQLVSAAPSAKPLRAVLYTAWAAVDAVHATLETTLKRLDAAQKDWAGKAAGLLGRLDQMTDPALLNELLRDWLGEIETSLTTVPAALLPQFQNDVAAARAQLTAAAGSLVASLTALAEGATALAQDAIRYAAQWLPTQRARVLALVPHPMDCDALGNLCTDLQREVGKFEAQVREQVTGVLGALADEATRARLGKLEQLQSSIGKGIKLAKAIGELPALPTLRFNAERAEYVFDDFKKQIETSPFAARLREIDSGLKELGLAVPTRQLLDQIIPDGLEGLDFNRVFKNLGGLNFQDFFKRFQLPKLPSDKIKITHGLDKSTRTAWVKTAVDADFPEPQELFAFAGIAVQVGNMGLRANSDIRISADGEKRAITDGRFTGDWVLDFGGTPMATFQQVTVSFDGGRFNFDISPDKVLLHPSLRFIEEYARTFSDKLPPALQLEKDERGIPVGASANFSTLIDKLPPIPPVTIGPILLTSGLGLRMNKAGVFEISAHLSLGAKNAPVFVQVSYLGGGFWLEARCSASNGIVVPQASLGLALGSMRAFTLAGVARGSYSVLLFANAEIDANGGSLHAGLSIAGSARILGIANAALDLLLEVEHHHGGSTCHGWLHVEIEICWCYTLRVSTAAEHKL